MLVGVVCCNIQLDAPHHTVFEQYVDELAEVYGFTPVLIPAFRRRLWSRLEIHLQSLVERLDGFLLPGSPSDVHPDRYAGVVTDGVEQSFDSRRDQTSLTLIRRAIDAGRPILGICRGMQEINVALGGTLTWVPSVAGILAKNVNKTRVPEVDHTARKTELFADKYLPAHPIELASNGMIAGFLQQSQAVVSRHKVNSLHRQCIDRLGAGLKIEAVAEDGVIEAISLDSYRTFCLGVQWHPEWFSTMDALNDTILKAFVSACGTMRRCG